MFPVCHLVSSGGVTILDPCTREAPPPRPGRAPLTHSAPSHYLAIAPESDRYKISELMSFIAGRPLPVDSPSLPFCIRFNVSLQTRRRKWRHVPYRDAAILDTEPVASSLLRRESHPLAIKPFPVRTCIVLFPMFYGTQQLSLEHSQRTIKAATKFAASIEVLKPRRSRRARSL